jgi:hypothetical protein
MNRDEGFVGTELRPNLAWLRLLRVLHVAAGVFLLAQTNCTGKEGNSH